MAGETDARRDTPPHEQHNVAASGGVVYAVQAGLAHAHHAARGNSEQTYHHRRQALAIYTDLDVAEDAHANLAALDQQPSDTTTTT